MGKGLDEGRLSIANFFGELIHGQVKQLLVFKAWPVSNQGRDSLPRTQRFSFSMELS